MGDPAGQNAQAFEALGLLQVALQFQAFILNPFLIGDIQHHAFHPTGLALNIRAESAALAHMADFAVGPHDAIFGVQGGAALFGGDLLLAQPLQIIRMNHLHEPFGRDGFACGPAEDAVHFIRPLDPPALQIAAPAAQVRNALGFGQVAFGIAQPLLRMRMFDGQLGQFRRAAHQLPFLIAWFAGLGTVKGHRAQNFATARQNGGRPAGAQASGFELGLERPPIGMVEQVGR